MAKISLVEQYNNKDVITQVYQVKDELENANSAFEEAIEALEEASGDIAAATAAANNASALATQLGIRTGVLEGYVGSPSDTASPTGSVYARIAENKDDITDTNTALTNLGNTVSGNSTDIANIKPVIQGLPTNYQQKSEKNQNNGYAGLTAGGKLVTSQIDTGVNLNQILQAGAQLNTGEFLYIGTGGVIRSRVIGEGVKYVGNYASLAALEAYPNPENGDFGTVYGTVSDDGFYMYDGVAWNKAALFDATDYELIANKTTSIDNTSTNTQYPTAKAVYDYDVAKDVASLEMSQNAVTGKVTVGVTAKNAAATTLATASVDIATTNTATANDYKPITSDGVASVATTINGNISTAVAGKQDTLTSTTITLAAANWSSKAQTITGISNVTATNIVWLSPTASNQSEYMACGIYATAQGSGSLTFTCTTEPTSDISVIVIGA